MRSDSLTKILAVRLDRIGDVLLSTPAFRAIKDGLPGCRLTVMVKPQCGDIVAGNPSIDEVILYDKDKTQAGIWQTLKLIRTLRVRRFDAAIVLHPTVRSHLIVFLAGIPVRIGFDRKGGRFLTVTIPHEKQKGQKHEIDYTLDIVRLLGIKVTSRNLYMPVSQEAERSAEKVFLDAGLRSDRPVVVIHPAASCPSKRWPAERFGRLADALIARFGVQVVIVGGAAERVFGDAVAAAMEKRCVNVSGRLSLAELASVLRRSQLLVSCDSGPVHVACAVGTPVVAIFGRSDKGLSPLRWGPTGPKDVVVHKNVGCVTCRAHACDKNFQCLGAITVEEVIGAARKILSL